MKILFLDLANKTGWAHSNGDSGVWTLCKRGDNPMMRLMILSNKLSMIRFGLGVDLVFAEAVHVRFANAAVSLAELHGAVGLWCATNAITFRNDIRPTSIKKIATENGRASKSDMIQAARQFTGQRIVDDNEADAVCLRHYYYKLIDSGETVYASQ